MWIFRKNRGHISLETLSEYIDGRLSSGESEKVERHLEGCPGCSAELESLTYTVSLLRRMPVTSPRRAYTLGEAPPVVASTPWRARVPVWAYGAAASVFVVLFALVLSANLSGSLTGDGPSGFRSPDQQDAPMATVPLLEPMPDSEEAKAADVPPPTATPAPQPTPVLEAAMESAPAVTPTLEVIPVPTTGTPAPQPTATPAAMAMEADPAVTPTPQAAAFAEAAETADADSTPPYEQATEEAASPISTPRSGATPLPAPTATSAPIAVSPSDSLERDATLATAVPKATPVPMPTASTPEAAAMADDADSSIGTQVAKEVDSSTSIPPPTVTSPPAPTASPTAPTVVASPTVANRLVDRFEQGATPMPTVALSPTPVPAPTLSSIEWQAASPPDSPAQAGPAREVSSLGSAEDSSTSIVWRVLEVVLGVAAAVLVGGILWRLRYRQRRTIS